MLLKHGMTNELHFLSDFKEAELINFRIVFPKGSKIRALLDRELVKFVDSLEYYSLIEKFHGKDAMLYCEKIRKSLRTYNQSIANAKN